MTKTRYAGESSVGHAVVGTDDDGSPYLIGSRCPACGATSFPGRVLCARDLHECEPARLANSGRIYEAVEVTLAPQGFLAPYWVGYIDLDAGPRVFGRIAVGTGEADPAHGDRVGLMIAIVNDPAEGPVFGPVFRKEK